MSTEATYKTFRKAQDNLNLAIQELDALQLMGESGSGDMNMAERATLLDARRHIKYYRDWVQNMVSMRDTRLKASQEVPVE